MKNYIAAMLGILIISLVGCKNDNGEHNLKAKIEIRKFDSSQVDDSLEDGLGEISNTFQEKEELAFYLSLTNSGVETRQISWVECHFSVVQLYNSDNELVFHSQVRPVGCSANVKERIVYSGESLKEVIDWDQELYTYSNVDGLIQTGEYLTPGEYKVVSYVSVDVGPFGDGSEITIDMEEQTITIEPAAQ